MTKGAHRWSPPAIAVAGVAIVVLLAACSPSSIAKSLFHRATSAIVTLSGQRPAVMQQAKDIGAKNPSDQLNLTIALPLRNQTALHELLANLYDSQSPFYHSWLTPDQYRQQFGPTTQTVQEVSSYLTSSGLTVAGVSTSNQFIKVSGTVSTIETAFHVQLHQYTYHGQTYYGPVSNPGVSGPLAGLVQNISGLDNFGRYAPGVSVAAAPSNGGLTPQVTQKAYDASPLYAKGINGSGQTIAFLELSDYQASDIQHYEQEFGLSTTTPQTIQVDGGAQIDNGTIEAELDLENAIAVAPKATELVYEGPNNNQGINDVYSQIVNDDKAKIVSISWGLCEPSLGSQELQTLDQTLQQGAAEGISFFAAAGDAGAYDCGDNNLAVDNPADDPNVTGVGGTTLTLNSDGSYGSETAWSCTDPTCTQNTQNGAGGGGGISQQFTQPSWQAGLNPPGASGQSGRFVPDVSADADHNTGYDIYCSASGAQGCSGDNVVGGTSAAAPLWAGAAALFDQSLKGPQGNLNPALYAVGKAQPSAFHDVTQGNNLNYNAGPGYDLATGWGSPDISALAQALATTSTGTPPTGTPPTGTPTPSPTPGSGTPIPSPTAGGGTPIPGPTGAGQELLANNGFENGTSPWIEQSAGNYELIDTSNPHSGSYNAAFCGYASCDDILAQTFQVPQGATSLSLSYYWYMATNNTSGCTDTFTVTIDPVNQDGTLGSPLATAQSACNSNANNAYAQMTANVSAALQAQPGTTLAVIFEGTTGSSGGTEIYLDDVSLLAS